MQRAQEFLMVNDYSESHSKVRVTNAAWRVTCHMNYGWAPPSSYPVIHVKESVALEKLS